MVANHQSTHHLWLALLSCGLLGITWWWLPHPLIAPVLAAIPVAIMLVIALPFPMVLLFVIFSFFRIHEVFPALYNLKIPLMLSLASIAGLGWHIGLTQRVKLWWSRELT
ncbi:MAG: oligosaccharide repeat unit polymerase, partial [Gammaproteobacteria bacterium]|nr:oligosaccharide repeat unit polymerase [Gammaproteobacteria bacterium]